jgi:hypothetical protein
MAIVKVGELQISTYMSDLNPKTKTNKVSSTKFRITAASATAYNAAADDAARAATAVGDLITAYEELTLGVTKSVTVGFVYEQNLAPPAADTFAFEFDKFLLSMRDTVTSDPVKTSIPARNDAAIVIQSDGTSVSIADPDMSTYVDAVEAIVLSGDNNAVQVLRASISS